MPQEGQNGFEGSLQIRRTSLYDTTYITYKIKDSNIKIEEFDSHSRYLSNYIVNLGENKVYAVDPINKYYKPIETRDYIPKPIQDFEIIKSENFRYINGYRCNQWRIKNREENTEITYWVTQGNFSFYPDCLRALNSIDKIFNYYLQIPDTGGFLPMLTVERTLLRDEKGRVEILRITQKSIPTSEFKIPENYRLFR